MPRIERCLDRCRKQPENKHASCLETNCKEGYFRMVSTLNVFAHLQNVGQTSVADLAKG
jgi:hypothetical protein